jgi:MFS superfamily sulfate permease-like transporter
LRRALKYYRIIWLKYDFTAGISVFLVALPLCLGIALASGAPLYAGLLSGIIGGIVVSLISGSQLSVSGPAAGLTTLVAASIASLGDYAVFLLSVMIAGLFQLILGILKLGVIGNYFPSSVIKGMLSAIGIILIAKQIPLSIGYEDADFWSTQFLQLFTAENFFDNISQLSKQVSTTPSLLTIVSIALLILLQKKKLKLIPPALMIVSLGILASLVLENFSTQLNFKSSQLVFIPANIFNEIIFPKFNLLFSNLEIWKLGITIGMLASLETLLCVEAIDKLDKRNRITPMNRELVAQGIGNITCGLLGAIPLTAVVVRGAANVDAGGKTKLSSLTHGILLLVAVLTIPFVLNKIPYASLCAILIMTGYNLTKPQLYKHMWNLGWKQFIPFICTISIILLTDLLIGVAIGLLIAVYFIVRNNSKEEFTITKKHMLGIDHYTIQLHSNVTFLNKVNLKKTLDIIPNYSKLVIDGSNSTFIDHDILEIISEFHNKAHDRHIELELINIQSVNVQQIH